MRSGRLAASALVLTLAAGLAPALAAEVRPEEAQKIEASLKTWLGGVLGPSVALPDRPVQLTAEGDHYKVLLPISGLQVSAGKGSAPAAITATARPGPENTWALQQIRLPADGRFMVGRTGEGGAPEAFTVLMHIGEQDSNALLNVNLTTPSRADFRFSDFAFGIEGPNHERLAQHADRYAVSLSAEPSANGRLNVIEEATGENFSSSQQGG